MNASAPPIRPVLRAIIDLDDIVGAVAVKRSFDDRLGLASNLPRHRSEGTVTAARSGRPLPPIAVIRRSDGLYVVDSGARVSVARALDRDSSKARFQPVIT